MSETKFASGFPELGEINVRALNRRIGEVATSVDAAHRKLDEQVIPALDHIATELGALRAHLIPSAAPPPHAIGLRARTWGLLVSVSLAAGALAGLGIVALA